MSARQVALRIVPLLLLAACDDPTPPDPPFLEVEVSTDGASSDLDADGYRVVVDGRTRTVSPNGTLSISDLEPGDYTVRLDSVESNCAHTGQNPQLVTLERGQVTSVSFTLACVPRRGSLRVAISTAGPDPDPDGYLLTVLHGSDGADVLFSGTVEANEEILLEDVPGGPTEARLSDLAANCQLTGESPTTAQVTHGGSHGIAIAVACLAPLELEVSISTTGAHTPSGYTISAAGENGWTSVEAPATGVVRLTGLQQGSYTVFLLRADPSCDTEANALEVDGDLGGEHQLSFVVTCAEPGELAFVRTADGDPEIYTIRDDGTGLTRLTENTAADEDPAWSPDGARIAFTSDRDGNREIYLMDADGSGVVRLTDHAGADRLPKWSPDGARILFVSERDGNREIYSIAPDGGVPTRLTDDPGADADPAWSPDGSQIAFIRDDLLHVMNADGTGVRPLTSYDDYYYYRLESAPAWSPDGSRIAFAVVWCDNYYNSGACWESNLGEVAPDGSEPPAPAFFGPAQPDLDGSAGWTRPAWYPDGRKIGFTSDGECDATFPADCTRSVRLLRPGVEILTILGDFSSSPVWRPLP